MVKAERYKGDTCGDCGVRVGDREIHDKWHDEFDEIAARVTRWIAGIR